MNPALLKYYSQELQHLREMGGEFAAAFPKIAGRLGLDGFECADPYVERLLEGFSFLAARVQMKLDAEFPRFTQHLLELAYPHYLAPTPSMAVVQLQADHANPQLAASADGVVVPRHTALRSMLDKSASTRCEYRTAHAVTLWPIEIAQAKFFTHAGSLDASGVGAARGRQGGIAAAFARDRHAGVRATVARSPARSICAAPTACPRASTSGCSRIASAWR